MRSKSYWKKIILLISVFSVLGTSVSFAISKQELNNDIFINFDFRNGHRYFSNGNQLTGVFYDIDSIEVSLYNPPHYSIDIVKYVTSVKFEGISLYKVRYFYNFNTKEIYQQNLSYTSLTEDGQEKFKEEGKGKIQRLTNEQGTAMVNIGNRQAWKDAIQIWEYSYCMPFLL